MANGQWQITKCLVPETLVLTARSNRVQSAPMLNQAALSRVMMRATFVVAFLVYATNASAQQPLRWGADPSGGAPYVFNDPNHPDQYIGYEKEMVDALATAMGRKAEFVPSDWETLVSALQRKSFDVIVNGLEPTADRQKQIQFSKPYYIFQLALTVRSDEQQLHSLVVFT